ncbi:MAG TPA: zinc-dependent alcohol dehydrogenase family protein [Candidatus Deferrimicrobium sp.]|nr:zinc-dependent alcohol dehydrogenase family protein [Candidatus Deferrimicrobium sp.]
MRAVILEQQKQPLRLTQMPIPTPGPGQVLIRIKACGVCRTDLHIVDGELTNPKLPLVPGHQIVGVVHGRGTGAERYAIGERVAVPWLGGSCGVCPYCRTDRENLCDQARYTGYHIDGGFAEFCVADERFCFPIPRGYPDDQAAPLLCAGLIGYRALRMTGNAQHLGFYGFGAAAHILAQVAVYQKREVYAFTRRGDIDSQSFAMKLGAVWAGDSGQSPPHLLDAAIIFAPDGALVPVALKAVDKGGVVVCAGIHMSDIPSFPYSLLWEERILRSVANLTRRDAEEFLSLAPQIPVRIEVHTYPLERGNEALNDLRAGRFTGAAVVVIG